MGFIAIAIAVIVPGLMHRVLHIHSVLVVGSFRRAGARGRIAFIGRITRRVDRVGFRFSPLRDRAAGFGITGMVFRYYRICRSGSLRRSGLRALLGRLVILNAVALARFSGRLRTTSLTFGRALTRFFNRLPARWGRARRACSLARRLRIMARRA